MSALTFKPGSDCSWRRCESPGCLRNGRYRVLIAGYVTPSEIEFKDEDFLVCLNHKKKWEGMWDEFGGSE